MALTRDRLIQGMLNQIGNLTSKLEQSKLDLEYESRLKLDSIALSTLTVDIKHLDKTQIVPLRLGEVAEEGPNCWACPSCGRLWSSSGAATWCKESHVRYQKDYSEIDLERVKVVQWNQEVCAVYYAKADMYFLSLDEIKDYFETTNEEVPEFMHACSPERWMGLDIGEVLYSELENTFEGAEDQLVELGNLKTFIDEWNSKQNIMSYNPDYNKVVKVR